MSRLGELYDHEIFICNCEDVSHQLILTTVRNPDNEDDKELTFSIHLTPDRTLWERLKVAIKYVFGHRSKYGAFDTIMLSLSQMKNLRKTLNDSITKYERMKF